MNLVARLCRVAGAPPLNIGASSAVASSDPSARAYKLASTSIMIMRITERAAASG
jgi:hypothetical protein